MTIEFDNFGEKLNAPKIGNLFIRTINFISTFIIAISLARRKYAIFILVKFFCNKTSKIWIGEVKFINLKFVIKGNRN